MAEELRRKVVTLGEYGVGKTTLIYELADKREDRQHAGMMGIDFTGKVVTTEAGERLRLLLWDTASVERFGFPSMRPYLRNANVVLLVYDISKRDTFEKIVEKWFPQYEEHAAAGLNAQLILVGHDKHLCETEHARSVGASEAEQWAARIGMPFVEVCCISRKGIDELLQIVVCAALTERKYFCGHRPGVHKGGGLGVRLPSSLEARKTSGSNSSCAGGC